MSNFRPWDVAALQAEMANRLATNQIELGLHALEPFTNGDLTEMQRLGMPPMAWSPLGGGRLMTDTGPLGSLMDGMAAEAGVDRAALAVGWLLAHPARVLPVLGTNSLPRIARLAEALRAVPGRVDWFRLYQAALGREVA